MYASYIGSRLFVFSKYNAHSKVYTHLKTHTRKTGELWRRDGKRADRERLSKREIEREREKERERRDERFLEQ